jgi:hypothetical protein
MRVIVWDSLFRCAGVQQGRSELDIVSPMFSSRGGSTSGGIAGTDSRKFFISLLISIDLSLGSTKSLRDFGRRARVGPERSGGTRDEPRRREVT